MALGLRAARSSFKNRSFSAFLESIRKMSFYEASDKKIDGTVTSMSEFKGDVLLIVNVACKCGLTALNYQQLPQLYDEYASKGLKILAFPCNQFGSQEPGSHAEILEFVKKYDADMAEKLVFFEKADVNGVDARAPFVALKDACPSDDGTKDIGWNFQKFLVDHEGMPFKNYSPRTAPVDMKADIDALLSKRG